MIDEQIKEISLFLRDKPLQLANALAVISTTNILAFSIDRSGAFSVIRVLVDDSEKAEKLLSEKAYNFEINWVIAVELPHQPGELSHVAKILGLEGINIDYGYLTIFESSENAVIILRTKEPRKTLKVLREHNLRILSKIPS